MGFWPSFPAVFYDRGAARSQARPINPPRMAGGPGEMEVLAGNYHLESDIKMANIIQLMDVEFLPS